MPGRIVKLIFVAIVAGACGIVGYRYGRMGIGLPTSSGIESVKASESIGEHGHDHHGEPHVHGSGSDSLPLSEQARQNLGLRLGEVSPGDFQRTIVVPGEVVEKPGHSESRITATINGIIRQVHVLPGQTVHSGDPLFDIQATGEVLANAQSALLKTMQELELTSIELERLKPITENGAVPRVRLLEKQYERQRLESLREVQIQELLVRGLSADQIDQIVTNKILLRQFTVKVSGGKVDGTPEEGGVGKKFDSIVPAGIRRVAEEVSGSSGPLSYTVERISVFPGKQVQQGEDLCDLAIHTALQISGKGFQSESELIGRAFEEQQPITAIFDTGKSTTTELRDLRIQYVDNVIDAESRLFRFYLPIRNEIIRDLEGPGGTQFRSWKYKPGQRVRLLIPVEHWTEEIVVPTEAVVKEGAEAYVFRANGTLMERIGVTVKYEDPRTCVVENDGSLFPGDMIAMNEAYQLNLALRKQQGSGTDLHAGHNH